MTQKEVIIDLFVNLGVAFTKAANMLAQSGDMPSENQSAPVEVKEEPTKAPAPKEGYGLSGMSVQDALALISNLETEEELKAAGMEEKARGSKARKGVMKAVQAKLDKLKNPPEEVAHLADEPKEEAPQKAFTADEPATTKEDRELFKSQFKALNEQQKDDYLDGKIDSLGNSLGGEDLDDLDDLGGDDAQAPTITQDELREKLKAYARAFNFSLIRS